ncbi:MAG: AAA family ATPase [Gammaproteobacteria bacterium]|nr:AAA family ATPase [Gammaproteobacteria bacterium]
MRLHRMRLKNYRGVDEHTLEFSIRGVTIVEGDNEVGKTCIPEALRLILSELDSSTKQRIRDLEPVHRDEGPEVEVELSTGPYRLVFAKRWRRKPMTSLQVSAPKPEQHSGREAHERVQAILEETLDQDLWQALSVQQGEKLNLPSFAHSSLGQALDRAAGGGAAVGVDDSLFERIGEERQQYWTATGRKSRDRISLDEQVNGAAIRVKELQGKLGDIEDDVREVARLAEEERKLIDVRDQSAQNQQALSKRMTALRGLKSKLEGMEAAHNAADAKYQQVAERLERRQELIDDLRTKSQALSDLRVEARSAAPDLDLAIQRGRAASAELEKARASLKRAEDALSQANADHNHLRNLIDKEQLSERHKRVMEAQEALRKASKTLDASKVNEELVARIEEANVAVEKSRAARDASAAFVETTVLSPTEALIDGEKVGLEINTPRSSVVTSEWELVVPNVIRVGVRPGTDSRDLAAEFEAAVETYNRLCTEGGVNNLAEARRQADHRQEALRQRNSASKTIEQDLRDLTPELLAQKVGRLAESTAAYPSERVCDAPLPSSFEDAERLASDAKQEFDDCQADFQRCQDKAEKARQRRHELEEANAATQAKISSAEDAESQAKRKLQTARDEQSDDDLDNALTAQKVRVGGARTALEEVQEELRAQDPDSLEALLENASKAKERAERNLRENQDNHLDVSSRLETLGEQGTHAQLNDARSEHAHLQREHDQTEARAEAALLLYDTFKRHRLAAHQRYVEPFKQRVEGLGRIVFGPTFEVELDTDLSVVSRTLDGKTLKVDQLSVGAQEQLGVICRLACAAIISDEDGGAPVVIDDALGWSDPTRLQAMGAAIAAAGKTCQVIVLTCTPGRYAHVGDAQVVRLSA